MRILIVGAGLIGVTTAYRLQRAGHEVIVLEQAGGPALGASFANGGMLTPSMADPWNTPGLWRDLLRWMGDPRAPMLLQWRALPRFAGWGLRFLAESSPSRYSANTRRNARLALLSVAGTAEVRREERLDYDAGVRGALKIYRDAHALERGVRVARDAVQEPDFVQPLDVRALIELEPALAPIERRLAGALYFPRDEHGDAHRFTLGLCEAAKRRGADFRLHTRVSRVITSRGRVTGVEADGKTVGGDAVVIAAGCRTPELLRGCAVRLPIEPVKGYSLTCALDEQQPPLLRRPLIDDALHAAVTPLGTRLRIAGTAEFAGFDDQLTPSRLANLHHLLAEVLPEHATRLSARSTPWAGLRPMSVDGVPCIGQCGPDGLYVNSGHGHLGWTMADGSARLLTALIDGESPPLNPADYSPKRFA